MKNSIKLCLSLVVFVATSLCADEANKTQEASAQMKKPQNTALTQQLIEQCLKHNVIPLENGVPVMKEGKVYQRTLPYGTPFPRVGDKYTITTTLKSEGIVEISCKKTDIAWADDLGVSLNAMRDLHALRVLNPVYAQRSDAFTRCEKVHDDCDFVCSHIDFECKANVPAEIYNDIVQKALLLVLKKESEKSQSS